MQAVSLIGVVAAFSLIFLSLLALCAERGFRPDGKVAEFFKGLSPARRLLLLVFVGILAIYAGTKDDDSTNAPPTRMAACRRIVAVQPGVTISESETDLGYRVLEVRDANEIVPPTIDTVTNESWRLRGAYRDAFRIGMDPEPTEEDWALNPQPEFQFPWRDSWMFGLTVFANGRFQPSATVGFFPCPFETDVSLVPQGKWDEIAMGGLQSLFWHELTPSNSLVLTWQNALYGRDANFPTNFQAELFDDGSFDYRYPDRTVSYVPVFPFDWDGDGLENSVDPEPFVAGTDAHGTNVEWYNTVCSNVFTAIEGVDGIELSPRHAGVNTNAYYFVDVVAERGPAPIYFTADGESHLGNPVIVARAGVTNHVPLLIGATYTVTSVVPLNVMTASARVCVETSETDDSSNLKINMPAGIGYTENNGVYMPMEDDLGLLLGNFSWQGGCCVHVLEGTLMSFQCSGCGCTGCRATLNYTYEGYTLSYQGPSCGCSMESTVGSSSYGETTSHGFVRVGFDKKAVIFEDAYDDSPSRHVERRSTETILTVRAYGGSLGGSLLVDANALNQLELVDGTWPSSRTLAPDEVYEAISTNKGFRSSAALQDVVVGVDFMPTGSAERVHVQAGVTSVRVEVRPEKKADGNTCANRHRLGVCEVLQLIHEPVQVDLSWTIPAVSLYSAVRLGPGMSKIMLPVKPSYFVSGLRASCFNVSYYPNVELVVPEGILCSSSCWDGATKARYGEHKGQAGWVGMYLELYVTPRDVSFENIDVQEEPSDLERHTAYYNFLEGTEWISHNSGGPGAGSWHRIGAHNYFTRDHASTNDNPSPWVDNSELVWMIPHAWRQSRLDGGEGSYLGTTSDGSFATACEQRFTLDAHGTVGIWKHGRNITRTTNNCVRVQGNIVYGRD